MQKLQDKKNFIGINPEEVLQPRESAIFNLDEFDGSHWTACWHQGSKIEYFDSYGLKPSHNIQFYLLKSNVPIFYNTTQLQPTDSESCGYFAIKFIKSKKNFSDFLDQFVQKPSELNDDIIR